MPSTFQGHALIYGLSTTGNTVQIGSFYAQAFLDSLPIAYRAKMDEHIGTSGLTSALVFTNPYFEISLSLRPASTTATPDAQAIFIPKGSTVTLSGFKPVRLSATDILNGDWIVVSDATLTLNKDEAAMVDVTVRRWVDSAQMTLLKTVVDEEA